MKTDKVHRFMHLSHFGEPGPRFTKIHKRYELLHLLFNTGATNLYSQKRSDFCEMER